MDLGLSNIILVSELKSAESAKLKAFKGIASGKFSYLYFFQRLKFLILNFLISFFLIAIFYDEFIKHHKSQYYLIIFSLYQFLNIALALWWGITNKLTKDTKNFLIQDQRSSAYTNLSYWLGNSIFYSLLASVFLIILISNSNYNLSWITIILLVTRFFFRIIIRVIFAYIYSVKRIIIPLWLLIFDELYFICSILASVYLNSQLINYSNILINIFVSLAFIYLAYYQALKLELIKPKIKLKLSFPKISYKSIMQYALPALALHLNIFLSLKLTSQHLTKEIYLILFFSYCYKWVKNFYLDFTDSQQIASREYLKNFQNYFIRCSILIGLVLTVFYILLCYLIGFKINFYLCLYFLSQAPVSFYLCILYAGNNCRILFGYLIINLLAFLCLNSLYNCIEFLATANVIFLTTIYICNDSVKLLLAKNYLRINADLLDSFIGKKSFPHFYIMKISNLRKGLKNKILKTIRIEADGQAGFSEESNGSIRFYSAKDFSKEELVLLTKGYANYIRKLKLSPN